MALATILLHLNFTFTLLLIHPPAGMVCAGMCVETGACVCVRGRCWATAGSWRVSGAFVALSTGQLAVRLNKIHIFSSTVSPQCSSNPPFRPQQLAAPCT